MAQAQASETPLWFARKVCGFTMLQPLHQEWMAWAARTPAGILLAPPLHFKTTTLSLAYPAWRLFANPELSIVLATKKEATAKTWIRTISDLIEASPILQHLYDPQGKWSERELCVRRQKISQDASLYALGVDSTAVSIHADLLIVDDAVDEENSRTPGQQEGLLLWFNKTARRIVKTGGQILVMGHRWQGADLYGRLLNTGLYQAWIQQALGEDGTPLCPEAVPLSRIQAEREALGAALFACQWLQKPELLGGKVFKMDWFADRRFTAIPEGLLVFQFWDLAISEKETAHYTACVTIGLHPSGDLYVLDAQRRKCSFAQQLAWAEDAANTWHPIDRGAEDNQYQKAFAQAANRSVWPMRGVTSSKDVVTRARPLSAMAEAKRVWVREGLDWLIEELVALPDGDYDDGVSAICGAAQLAGRGPTSTSRTVEPEGRARDQERRGGTTGLRGSWRERM